MQIRVLFFGMLKDLAGRSSDSLTLPENATLGDVLQHYEQAIPRELIASLAMSVNQEYAAPDARLRQGDEVALLPPVSGGSTEQPTGTTGGRSTHAAIVSGAIDTSSLLKAIKQPEDGAAVVFEGIVRNHTRGRRTLFLDYEAYEEMALKQMEELAERALADFKIRDVAIVHRLGRLEIGETSVLIVVASAHRGAASSTRSNASCPSGKRSISKTAPSGPMENPFRTTFQVPRAPIPQSVHLSERPFSCWVQNAAKHSTFPDETSCNCWPCAGPVPCLRCPGVRYYFQS